MLPLTTSGSTTHLPLSLGLYSLAYKSSDLIKIEADVIKLVWLISTYRLSSERKESELCFPNQPVQCIERVYFGRTLLWVRKLK